ncbi:hypothetical protein ASG43_07065 [Aureimonas sp. Leaf454]|nr:hypothetical protein ASG43_07065 [Aureimonas sp. Leaf454]
MRTTGWIAGGFVATLVVFLSRTVIAGAVVSQGVLVVDTGAKKIQHQSGGVVRELLVSEGDRVKAGQPLVVLDRVVTDAQSAAVASSLVQKQARLDRLISERDGAETLTFPSVQPPVLRGHTAFERFLDVERRQFEIRRQDRDGQRRQLLERVRQAEDEIGGNAAQFAAVSREVEVVERELSGLRALFRKKLVTNERLSEIERSLAQLEGRKGSLQAAIASGKGRVSEIQLQILQVDQTLRSDLTDQISQTQQEVSDLAERRVIATEAQQRSVIIAPQDGVVHELAIHTIGGVIQPAEVLMLVVPEADALVGEIRVRPNDIDQLFPGQSAEIHFSAFDRGTTPALNGTLARVSPDLEQDPRTGAMFYKARIRLAAGELGRLGDLPLVAGMPLEVFVRTSDRTIASYLTKPLTDQISRSFR